MVVETEFGRNLSSYKAMYVGYRPPSNGLWETWLDFAAMSPYPIKYTLRPISELLKPVYFGVSDKDNLTMKKTRSVGFCLTIVIGILCVQENETFKVIFKKFVVVVALQL